MENGVWRGATPVPAVVRADHAELAAVGVAAIRSATRALMCSTR